MFFESAAYIVDALHHIGQPATSYDIGPACKTQPRTIRRHLVEMHQNGLVCPVYKTPTGYPRWILTARGEAFRQALMVQPEPLADGNIIEVAIVSDGSPEEPARQSVRDTLHVTR